MELRGRETKKNAVLQKPANISECPGSIPNLNLTAIIFLLNSSLAPAKITYSPVPELGSHLLSWAVSAQTRIHISQHQHGFPTVPFPRAKYATPPKYFSSVTLLCVKEKERKTNVFFPTWEFLHRASGFYIILLCDCGLSSMIP